MPAQGWHLAEWSRAIRASTLERLRQVPAGYESWRPSPRSLSFADIATHLIACDRWLFAKLSDPALGSLRAAAGEGGAVDRSAFEHLLILLAESGRERCGRLEAMSVDDLDTPITDDRFGGEVTAWWVIVRGNLDHEAHHRGQIASALRILRDLEAAAGPPGE